MSLSGAQYTALFEDLGEVVQGVNNMVNGSTDWLDQLDAGFTAIANEYTANDMLEPLDTLNTTINSVKDSVVSMAGTLSELATARLLHSSVIDNLPELGGSTTNITTVLTTLARDMIDDSVRSPESITSIDGVSLGTSTSDTFLTNTGNTGFSSRLAGKQKPHSTYPEVLAYAEDTTNNLSALFKEGEVYTLECTSDSVNSNIGEGNESFIVKGTPSDSTPWSYKADGAGNGPTIAPGNGSRANLMSNGSFELWEENPLAGSNHFECPTNFEATTGTCGTDIVRDGSATNTYHGANCLKLSGGTAPTIRQELNRNLFRPHTTYFIGVWLKKDSGIAAGAVTIDLVNSSGTIQTVAAGINLGHAILSTAYAFRSIAITTLADLSDPLFLQIAFTGSAGTDIVWLDYMGVVKAAWHGGIATSVFAGQDKFLIGDKISRTITTASGARGVFQEFFKEKYGIQMPYSGSPTQADSLATD